MAIVGQAAGDHYLGGLLPASLRAGPGHAWGIAEGRNKGHFPVSSTGFTILCFFPEQRLLQLWPLAEQEHPSSAADSPECLVGPEGTCTGPALGWVHVHFEALRHEL